MVEKAKVLITGSSGMLGSDICKVVGSREEIFGLDLIENETSIPHASNFVKCEITNKDEVFLAIDKIRPDFIIHTVAYTDVDGCESDPKRAFSVNTQGTENIANAAKRLNISLFYISTDYVFDGNKDMAYTENDKPNPINAYGRSKLEGEEIIQNLLKKYLILRTSWLYGINGKSFVNTILQEAKKNEVIEVVNDQFGSPTYTLDLAQAISLLITKFKSETKTNIYGIYHITNQGSCSWYELANQIVLIKQLRTKIIPISSGESKRSARRPRMSVLDNSMFITTFRLKLRPWQEALRDFLFH